MDLDFSEACGYVMPLGKHRGSTLAQIGSSPEGLRYLDWLIGQDWVNGPLKHALRTYLEHPSVGGRLEVVREDEPFSED